MFKEYTEIKNEEFLVEGFGRSMGGFWTLPTSNPMGYFVSVFPDPYRPRILEWFMTDGLVMASQGRDELTEIINKNLGAIRKIGPRTANLPVDARVAEAFERSFPNITDDGIYPSDLFSPEARKRIPFLNNKLDYLDGLTIDEYYDKTYEPKVMRLQHGRGKVFDLIIPDVNTFLRAEGFPEFRYGGVQGYLQFVEKGAWMPHRMQRSHSDPNQQHGPDLSRAQHTTDDNARPIVQFQAGAVVREERKFRSAINDMQFAFNKAAERIQANRTVDNIPQEDQAILKGVLSAVDIIKRIEKSPNSHVNVAEMLFGIGRKMQNEEGQAPDMDEMYELLMQALDIGLRQPFEMIDTDITTSGEKVGAFSEEGYQKALKAGFILEREYAGKKDVGKNRKVDRYVYRLGPKGIELAKNYITGGQARPTVLKTKIRWRVLFGLQGKSEAAPGKVAQPFMNPNMSVELSTLLNRGFETNPELYEGMALVGYEMAGAQPERFMREPPRVQGVFDAAKEKQLAEAGYRWELPKKLDEFEMKNHKPNWQHPNRQWARMVYKVKGEKAHDQIKVVRDKTGKVDTAGNPILYADLPLESDAAHAVEQARKHPMLTKGLRPAGMLLGGRQVTASKGLGHANLNPVRSQGEFDNLVDRLMQGEMGEDSDPEHATFPVSNPYALPSVLKGVFRGIYRSGNERRIDRVKLPDAGSILDAAMGGRAQSVGRQESGSTTIDAGEILNWAMDGLWGFSGDRAFQVGYLDPSEIRWNQEQEIEKTDEEGNPIGRGIMSILGRSYGDRQTVATIYAKIQELVKQEGYTWDAMAAAAEAGLINDAILKAIGENAFEARVEAIANHVSKRIEYEFKKRGGGKERQTIAVGDGEGRSNSPLEYGRRTRDYIDTSVERDLDRARLGSNEKKQLFGIKDPEPQVAGKETIRLSDDDDIEDNNALPLPSPKPTTARSRVPAKPTKPTYVLTADDDIDDDVPSRPAAQPALAARNLPPAKPTYVLTAADDIDETVKPTIKLTLKDDIFDKLLSYKEYTWAPYDGTKPKDGCGFNWWGAVGHPMGVSVTGEPIGRSTRKRRRKK